MENLSVKRMWESYLASINETIDSTSKSYCSWNFETTEAASNYLVQLVKEGKKTGTSCTKDSFETSDEVHPKIGDLHVLTNWDHVAQCIIQTTAINFIPYKDVSSEFAEKEGEGDLSLHYWKEVHRSIFEIEQNECGKAFTEDTLISCEEFKLIYQ